MHAPRPVRVFSSAQAATAAHASVDVRRSKWAPRELAVEPDETGVHHVNDAWRAISASDFAFSATAVDQIQHRDSWCHGVLLRRCPLSKSRCHLRENLRRRPATTYRIYLRNWKSARVSAHDPAVRDVAARRHPCLTKRLLLDNACDEIEQVMPPSTPSPRSRTLRAACPQQPHSAAARTRAASRPADLRPELAALVGADGVLVQPLELAVYECDGHTLEKASPIVVCPRSTEEVAAVLRAAGAARPGVHPARRRHGAGRRHDRARRGGLVSTAA